MQSFYNLDELKSLGLKSFGDDVKISRKCSIYNPQNISLGNHVRIDDFCCLVGGKKGITIGSYVHIAFFCVLVGRGGITMEDFSGLSSRVALYSTTDDYSGTSLTNPTIPDEMLNIIEGPIMLGKHVIIGTGSTVLPNVCIGEGSSIGANTLITRDLDPWGIYAGIPVRKIKNRKKDLLKMEHQLMAKGDMDGL